jgi:hypothetical protein
MNRRRSWGRRHASLIKEIFFLRYREGVTVLPFHYEDLEGMAKKLRIKLPEILGDAINASRHHVELPEAIRKTQPLGKEWVIEGRGNFQYAFRLVASSQFSPNPLLVETKVPNATPVMVSVYGFSDEQALLAKVRYNRLLDLFLSVDAHSLQSHLRTTVARRGQVEIDEIYIATNKRGRQYILPIQAKSSCGRLSTVQTRDDIAFCVENFPSLICRSIFAQFMAEDLIAMFELTQEDGEVRVVDEKHYRLVPSDQISPTDLKSYSKSAL